MTALVALAISLVVAGFVVLPLLTGAEDGHLETQPTGRELWTREKAVAVLAITEADFDLATGKLSKDDYRVLRSDYEGRALQAMDEIEKTHLSPVAEPSGSARFCPACGSRFGTMDRFCGGCGGPRGAI